MDEVLVAACGDLRATHTESPEGILTSHLTVRTTDALNALRKLLRASCEVSLRCIVGVVTTPTLPETPKLLR